MVEDTLDGEASEDHTRDDVGGVSVGGSEECGDVVVGIRHGRKMMKVGWSVGGFGVGEVLEGSYLTCCGDRYLLAAPVLYNHNSIRTVP